MARPAKSFSLVDMLRSRLTSIESAISRLNLEHAAIEAELLKISGAGAEGTLPLDAVSASIDAAPKSRSK